MEKLSLITIKIFTKVSLALLLSLVFILVFDLRINTTDSLPIGIYMTIKKAPEKGDIVSFCLMPNSAQLAIERHYLSKHWLNKCPKKSQSLLKPIVAMQGDFVTVSTKGVYVNKQIIEDSKPLKKDAAGNLMPNIKVKKRLAENEFLAISTFNPYSWDSRYYGAVPTTNILSVVRPVFTFNYRSWENQ